MTTTHVKRFVRAPPADVYRAFVRAEDVERWMVPDGMASEIHEFEPRVGGRFRISLRYDAPDVAGKTRGNVDTFHGRFVELVPGERIVQTVEFETNDPRLQGEMRIEVALRAVPGGTELEYAHGRIPPGVRPEDNEAGTRMSLAKLAALVEGAGSA